MAEEKEYQVLIFYKYVTLEDPKMVADKIRGLMNKLELKGRVIVAEEGINATLEGVKENTKLFLEELFKDERLSDIVVKKSLGTGASFPRISVKVRDEIVGTRFDKEKVDPRIKTAPKITAEELARWYKENRDFTVVDMRNDYEFVSGHFKDSVSLGLSNSRDLPEKLDKLKAIKDKKIVTVCTGGIRCEKMSALLLAEGFTNVYQLDGGIHTYMEKYPCKDFLGTLYTFDNRLTMNFGGEREIIGTCYLCNEKTEQYIDCQNLNCHRHVLMCDDCSVKNIKTCSKECAELLKAVN